MKIYKAMKRSGAHSGSVAEDFISRAADSLTFRLAQMFSSEVL